jgi:nicotinamidase-related amidase
MTADLADWIAPARTALLIVDMQVDFAAPEGAMGQAGADLSAIPAALAAAQRLAQAARAAGTPVIFVGLQTSAETDSPAWSERLRRLGQDTATGLCRQGQPGADFVGALPEPGEQVFGKPRYSAFFGTGLDSVLKAMDVDTLVIAGVTTECCVDCTARDAFHLDYHVFIPADACAAYEPDLHTGALKALALNCAIVTDTDEVLKAWRRSLTPPAALPPHAPGSGPYRRPSPRGPSPDRQIPGRRS